MHFQKIKKSRSISSYSKFWPEGLFPKVLCDRADGGPEAEAHDSDAPVPAEHQHFVRGSPVGSHHFLQQTYNVLMR